MRGQDKAKDPAAVALGRKRQAVTPDERRAFAQIGAEASRTANAARSPQERRAIAMRAARTRRLNPPWLRTAAPLAPPADLTGLMELAELARAMADALDAVPDDDLAAVAAAVAAHLPQ